MSDRYLSALVGLVWGAGYAGGIAASSQNWLVAVVGYLASVGAGVAIAIGLLMLSDRAP